MAEYITKEAARGAINHNYPGFWAAIDAMPAADVAPVVHGEWLKYYKSGVTVNEGWVSSCCDMWNNRNSNYCPNCGAQMNMEVPYREPISE